jgi:hypothetical protein
MFDDPRGNCVDKASIERCKPDYEGMAARLKSRIDADKLCLEGMKAGINSGSVDLSREQSILYYGVIGHLSVHIPKKESEYASLLKNIEDEG